MIKLFSKDHSSKKSVKTEQATDKETVTEAIETPVPAALERSSMAAQNEDTSPLALKLQEKQRQLDSLKIRVAELGNSFQEMESLAGQSTRSIRHLSNFLSDAKVNLETEIRLKSENAKLTTEKLDLAHEKDLTQQKLQESEAMCASLRQRGVETRTALETARDDIIRIKEAHDKLDAAYHNDMVELAKKTAQLETLQDKFDTLNDRYSDLEAQREQLKGDLDSQSKIGVENKKTLSEKTVLLEEEISKNSQLSGNVEALKREIAELRAQSIEHKSMLDETTEELSYHRNTLEEERRKHDNEVYALKSEIDNLNSQRRVLTQSVQESNTEAKSSKNRIRSLTLRLHEMEDQIEKVQSSHDGDKHEMENLNIKLREMGLRYNSILTDLNHERSQNSKLNQSIQNMIEENKSLQNMKIKYETSLDQIRELKSLITNYQMVIRENDDSIDQFMPDPAVDEKDDKVVVSIKKRPE
ncbi:hypothetical protein [Coralliovum pocilloporae]|uniref:hypothetical protein n=1 Tax=Coralliovum pocilloporae TaxID=3066369 RepID=UPI003307B750